MGMDSYIYKTKRDKHAIYMNARSMAWNMQFQNREKIQKLESESQDFMKKIKERYPALAKDMSYSSFVRVATKDEVCKLDAMHEEIHTLMGDRCFDGVDTSAGTQLAYWRKPYGLHHYIVHNFGVGEDNMTRIPLEPKSIDTLITYMKRIKNEKMLKNDTYFGNADGFWDFDDHKKAIEKFEKILARYKDNDLVYYWAWY